MIEDQCGKNLHNKCELSYTNLSSKVHMKTDLYGMDSYLMKELFRQDLQDLTGFYFFISSFLKKLEILNPLSAEIHTM